jgi:peroxiredoxin Q/BCP
VDDFAAVGAQVIGCSVDSVKANTRFAQKRKLTYPLICDTDYTIASAFGVARKLVGVAKRTTFVIDADGTLRAQFHNVSPRGHAAEVLAAARETWG